MKNSNNNKNRTPIEEYERRVRIERAKIAALCVTGLVLFCVLLALFASSMAEGIRRNRPAEPAEGIGRESAAEAQRYAAPAEQAEEGTALRVWCETDEDLPEWWDPESAEIVWQEPECEESCYNASAETGKSTVGTTSDNNTCTTHSDALDYNINTTLWGWDGHMMEVWEYDLFVRIVYLEFWGTSDECVEAGIDSILLLWDRGEYGRTMGELLSAQYAPGYYVYSPYAYVWDWTYDAEGLADIRTMCEERFAAGPTWCAPYFRLWYYHEWAAPAYEIDGVYFSVPRG